MSHFVPRRSESQPPQHLAAGQPIREDVSKPLFDDEAVDIRDVLNVLRRNAWLVTICALVTTAAAAFIVIRQEPEYRASATIRLKNERQSITGSLEGEALDQVMGRTADPLLSQLEQMRSRTLATTVVYRLGLRLQPIENSLPQSALSAVLVPPDARPDTLTLRFATDRYEVRGPGGTTAARYGEPVHYGTTSFTVVEHPRVEEAAVAVISEGRAVKRVQDNLRTSPRDKTDVVEVSFTSTDPVLSQEVANTAVDVFQRSNADNAQDQSRRRRIFLEQQLVKTDSALAITQTALSEFRQREQVFSSRDRFAAQQVGLMELEIQREQMLADRRVYTSLLEALSRAPQNSEGGLRALVSAPGLAANPVVSQLYQTLVRYELSRDSLTTGQWASAQSNPDVQRLNTLIANTQRGLIDAARSHVASLDARIGSLEQMLARNTTLIRTLPEKEAEEMRLVQQVETARQLADQLRVEYQRAQIAEAVEVGQVEIIDRAALPTEPVGSGRAVKLALGLILGLMVGSGGAFMREHLNTRITRKDDIEAQLGLPALAVIPRIEQQPGRRRKPLRLSVGARNGAHAAGTAVARPLEELVTIGDGRSSGAEAFRTLRTNLIFSQATQSLKSLMVTSPVAAEGKTTTAANLAVAFAQQGLRVILIDCDLRKARIHRVFNLEREPGLVDAIIGTVELDDVARPTPVAGLTIITAGLLPPNPAELLGSARMREILTRLEAEADLVIIDAPPVLVAGDASIMGSLAAGAVVVVRASRTEREAAKAAIQQLRTVGTRVLGAVLNDPDAKLPRYESHYYYAYGYYGEDS